MRAVETALFVVALLIGGLVVFALLWSGVGPYEELARANKAMAMDFYDRSGRLTSWDLTAALDVHRQWAAYVTGAASESPRFVADIRFTEDEYAHMADVRNVFVTAKFLVPVSLLVIVIRLQRARARSAREMWQLVRDGSLIAAACVVLIGIVATFAFEPLFLAFHYVFFPQGNFLFDPATSNLIRLYPDWYWEGISLRVGLSFIAVALGLAAVAQARLRSAK